MTSIPHQRETSEPEFCRAHPVDDGTDLEHRGVPAVVVPLGNPTGVLRIGSVRHDSVEPEGPHTGPVEVVVSVAGEETYLSRTEAWQAGMQLLAAARAV